MVCPVHSARQSLHVLSKSAAHVICMALWRAPHIHPTNDWLSIYLLLITEWFHLEGILKDNLASITLSQAGTPSTTPGSSKPHPAWPSRDGGFRF